MDIISSQIDNNAESELTILSTDLPAGRIVSSPTGPVNNDYVDVRTFAEATKKGIARYVYITHCY